VELEVEATREAFHHLVGLGHRRFLFVAPTRPGAQMTTLTRGRVESIRASVAEVCPDFDLMIARRQDEEADRRAIQAFATQPDPYTCFIAGSHAVAPAILGALFGAGIDIPSRASFIGFGDSDWAEIYRPPLATIRYDYYLEGRRAIERLLRRLDGETPASDELNWVASEFLARDSCGPAPR
jgi:DNA-binding LacI/PurR family transcriptional regulator